jgi:hypothetical protein
MHVYDGDAVAVSMIADDPACCLWANPGGKGEPVSHLAILRWRSIRSHMPHRGRQPSGPLDGKAVLAVRIADTQWLQQFSLKRRGIRQRAVEQASVAKMMERGVSHGRWHPMSSK